MSPVSSTILGFFAVALAVYVLAAAKAFFIPLVIAMVIWFAIVTVAEGLARLSLGQHKLPRFFAFTASFAVLFGALYVVVSLVRRNVVALVEAAPEYQQRLHGIVDQVSSGLGITLPDLSELFGKFDLVSTITSIVSMLTDVAGNAGLIAIYVIFLLIEYSYFNEKFAALFRDSGSYRSTQGLLKKMVTQVQAYFLIKTGVSFVTASLSYIVLVAVGVDFPDFWAFLIFLLNYIPTIGSIIATVFPSIWTIVQFDTFGPFIVVAVSLALLQFLIGNIFEPRIMGKRFNLSALVIILSLTIWGQIWGIVGMFLSVPIIAVLSIILSNFPHTRPYAILLSQDGEVGPGV